MRFDSERYVFVGARAPEGNFLETSGATAPLFLVHREGPGQMRLGSAIGRGQAASGDGPLAVLTFRLKRPFGAVWFERAEGILFDPNYLTNPVSADRALGAWPAPLEPGSFWNTPKTFESEVPSPPP